MEALDPKNSSLTIDLMEDHQRDCRTDSICKAEIGQLLVEVHDQR
jgi:hypothetical protein